MSQSLVSVSKWYLDCAGQTENVLALKKMAGVCREDGRYKPLRTPRILNPETLVEEAIRIFKKGFINLFSINTDTCCCFFYKQSKFQKQAGKCL